MANLYAEIAETGPLALAQTGDATLFTITGRVVIHSIVGIVHTAVQNQACNMLVKLNPTVGADVPLADYTSVANDAVGTLYTMPGTMARENLTEIDFASHANWDATGDFDDTVGAATYTHGAGAGTLTQEIESLAYYPSPRRWYRLTYTVSAVTVTGALACQIDLGFPGGNVVLDVSSNATRTVNFQAAAQPTSFVISGSSDTGGDTFTLDDLSLKAVVSSHVSGVLKSQEHANICAAGVVEQECSASNTGEIKWVCRWEPLDVGSTVTPL